MRVSVAQVQENLNPTLLPSKLFPLDRLLAIFYVIYEDERLTGDINSQLSSLMSLNLLARASGSAYDALDDIRLRCVCSHAVVARLAEALHFELHKFLHVGH